MGGEIHHLWGRMEVAREAGALHFLGQLQKFMRQHQLRAIDLFELVDTSGDGYGRAPPSTKTCIKAPSLYLTRRHHTPAGRRIVVVSFHIDGGFGYLSAALLSSRETTPLLSSVLRRA